MQPEDDLQDASIVDLSGRTVRSSSLSHIYERREDHLQRRELKDDDTRTLITRSVIIIYSVSLILMAPAIALLDEQRMIFAFDVLKVAVLPVLTFVLGRYFNSKG